MANNEFLSFNGTDNYIEIPDSPDLSVATTGQLTVSAWIRPATLDFPSAEASPKDPSDPYVHWMGKGEPGRHEWVFRMYRSDAVQRPSRISFYVFNPQGGLGVGSFFQDVLEAGVWIHVTGVADGQSTHIYRDGELRDSDFYADQITPARGSAPLRVGTRDFKSFFAGELREVRVWNRALTADEIAGVHQGTVTTDGLVAEYLLTQDIALDSASGNHGGVFGASWILQNKSTRAKTA